jgi:hypothetical protein
MKLIINLIFLSIISINTFEIDQEPTHDFSNEWVAQIYGGDDVANMVAQELGFVNKGKVSRIKLN